MPEPVRIRTFLVIINAPLRAFFVLRSKLASSHKQVFDFHCFWLRTLKYEGLSKKRIFDFHSYVYILLFPSNDVITDVNMDTKSVIARKKLLKLQAQILAVEKNITIDDAFDLLLGTGAIPDKPIKQKISRNVKRKRQHEPSSLLKGLIDKTYATDWKKTK